MTPDEQAANYFRERLAFCEKQGIPLTLELICTHLVGTIMTAIVAERERCVKAAEQGSIPHLSGFANTDLKNLRADIIRRIKEQQ